MFFARKLTKVEALCDEITDHFDCDACLWDGVTVAKGDIETAINEFDSHDCRTYINQNTFA